MRHPIAPVSTGVDPFVFLDQPARWDTQPVLVDVQAGGQPGLPGGGLAQLQNALAQWNGAGALFTYSPRSLSAAPRQGTVFGNSGVVTHVSNDPFAEISNTGGTLAVAFSWFTTAISQTVNGQPFRRMLEVVIISNDGTTAQNFITNATCFNQVMLHEQGHALGLGHSADPNAVMAATVSFAQCSAAPRPLQPDDIAGVRFIYPGGSTPPPGGPGTPTNVTAVVNGPVLTVGWTSAGANTTGNRLDFRAGSSPTGPVLVSVTVGPTTSITVGIPAGTTGTFNVTVTAFVGAVGGAPSAPAVFTIGGGPCVAPPTPTGLTGQIVGTLASVSFNPSPGATSYIVQAGTAFGLSNLFNANIGGATSVSAPVPAGFTAFVRVIAVNACGQSAPTADLALGFSLGVRRSPGDAHLEHRHRHRSAHQRAERDARVLRGPQWHDGETGSGRHGRFRPGEHLRELRRRGGRRLPGVHRALQWRHRDDVHYSGSAAGGDAARAVPRLHPGLVGRQSGPWIQRGRRERRRQHDHGNHRNPGGGRGRGDHRQEVTLRRPATTTADRSGVPIDRLFFLSEVAES